MAPPPPGRHDRLRLARSDRDSGDRGSDRGRSGVRVEPLDHRREVRGDLPAHSRRPARGGRLMELHFTNLLIVVLVGFLAPLSLGFVPRLLLPSVVLEIVLGIVIGPSVLGWVHVDDPVAVMSIVGLAFLLFLAGLEIEFDKLRGRVLKVTAIGFALSFGLALILSGVLSGVGVLDHPLFVAIVLSATSLGVVIPVLKDAGEVGSMF